MSRVIPYHPLLAAIVPVLLLLSANIDQAPPSIALRTLGTAVGLAALLWALLALALRSIPRAAAVTTFMIATAATVLPVYRVFAAMTTRDQSMHRIAIAGFVAVTFFLLITLAIRHALRNASLPRLNQTLNLAMVCLVIVPAVNIVRFSPPDRNYPAVVSPPPVSASQVLHQPDIYYIIPDGYGRGDVLSDLYGYDNSSFLQELEDLGFVVNSASNSNYAQTVLSVASSLNMAYISPPGGDRESTSREAAYQALLDNAVMGALKQAGYTTIAYSADYALTDLKTADVRIGFGPNQFERVAAATFSGPLWFAAQARLWPTLTLYSETTSMLARLGTERGRSEPIFVFAHFLAPHPPFVFNEDGTERYPPDLSLADGSHRIPQITTVEEYRADYARQVEGLNIHLLEAVRRIIDASDEPSVIIIQADHGPRSETVWEDPDNTNFGECMGILNAILVPEEMQEYLYPEMTPVNSFRLVLNYCFGDDIDVLEDRVEFSTWNRPYDFIDVTDRVRGGDGGRGDREPFGSESD